MAFKALTLNTPPEQAAHILAEDDAAIYAALMGDDRVLDIGNKLAATVITNNTVRISDGVAVVGGHAGRIIKGDYEDMTIENGASGKKRNDLICARFISNGNTDTYRLIVVKGASGTTAIDPTIVRGNLYNGDKQRDFPLWRVCLDGLSITKIEQMFTVSATNKYLADKTASLQTSVNQLNSNLSGLKFEHQWIPAVTDAYNAANVLTFGGAQIYPGNFTNCAFLAVLNSTATSGKRSVFLIIMGEADAEPALVKIDGGTETLYPRLTRTSSYRVYPIWTTSVTMGIHVSLFKLY